MTFQSDIAKFAKSLRSIVKKAEREGLLTNVAGYAMELIVKRVRRGYGVKTPGGSEYKFKPLSPSYVKRRKRSKLSAFTSPGKSNLTFTGQLLYSLRLKKGAKSMTITFDDSRSDGKSNNAIAKYVSKDRPFLNLSRDEGRKVEVYFRKTFDSLVKSTL